MAAAATVKVVVFMYSLLVFVDFVVRQQTKASPTISKARPSRRKRLVVK
jgi:hypothetical protein